MNPYIAEKLARAHQAGLLREAHELRALRESAPPPTRLDRPGAWARRLVLAVRELLWRPKGGPAQRRRA